MLWHRRLSHLNFGTLNKLAKGGLTRAKAVNTACYTQNRSLIHLRYNKTPYELMQDKKPDLSFFHVFGLLCYPTNDNDNLGKLDAKADIGIFVSYVPAKKAFRIYNKRTRKIIETIHVTFYELTTMASETISFRDTGLHSLTLLHPFQIVSQTPISQQTIMSFITAQQAKLYLQLVPKEKRLEIQKCNGRLNSGKIQREPTFQVVMDALALTLCYFAFLITVIVPEVYMHQFWDSV
ncbi:integrase, catalytic region, zinc finger, CCHC-type containing protein [Tanacetum coccineum]